MPLKTLRLAGLGWYLDLYTTLQNRMSLGNVRDAIVLHFPITLLMWGLRLGIGLSHE
jgi:hypothetical protein